MYAWKKGDFVVVIVLLLLIVLGFFFVHKANITGAVVSVGVSENLAATDTVTNQSVADSLQVLPVEQPVEEQPVEAIPPEENVPETSPADTPVNILPVETTENASLTPAEPERKITSLGPTVNQAVCGDLNSANTYYDLTNNVTSVGTCFNILASNITLDCHGFWINYSTGRASGFGINITTADNITIRDCIINTAIPNTTGGREALSVVGDSQNSTLFNSTLILGNGGSRAVVLQNARRWNLTNNTIYAPGTASAVQIDGSSLNVLQFNNITQTNTTGASAGAIVINDQSLNNTLSFNLINTKFSGIRILDASNYTNILSNTIITTVTISLPGILIQGSSYENLSGNIINTSLINSILIEGNVQEHFNHTIDYTNLAEGLPFVYNYSQFDKIMFSHANLTNIYGGISCGWCSGVNYTNITVDNEGILFFNVTNSRIELSNITGRTSLGAIYFSSSSGDTIVNNSISPVTTSSYGIYLSSGSNSSTIVNNSVPVTVTISDVRGIGLLTGSNNNLIMMNNINTSSATGYGIAITDSVLTRIIDNTVVTRGPSGAHALQIGGHNTTVIGNHIQTINSGATGIVINMVNYSIVINNSVLTAGGSGIVISDSSFTNLTANSVNATQGGVPVLVTGSNIDSFNQTIGISNLAYTLPIAYNFSQRHLVLFSDVNLTNVYGVLICAWCVNITYRNITFRDGGLILENVTASTVEFNNISVNSSHAIYLHTSMGNIIRNNSINVSNSIGTVNVHGVQLVSSHANVIANNTFRLSLSRSGAIILDTTANNNDIESNNIYGNAANTNGVLFNSAVTATGTIIRNNNITLLNATSSNGIQTPTAGTVSSTTVENNILDTVTDSIFMGASTSGMTLINNNITSSSGLEINDRSGNDTINYLVYNNTLGEIRWINQTGGARFAFLDNLTVLVTNDLGIGVGRNLFIDNNTFALNTSAFSNGAGGIPVSSPIPLINTSANITLYGLPFNNVIKQIRRVENYTTNSTAIRDAGSDCTSTSCALVRYNATTGTLFFNTSFFSSFTGFSDAPIFSSARNTSLNFRRFENATINITLDASALDVYVFVTNISGTRTNATTNTTRDISGAEYNASEPVNITLMKGTSACWYFWANSSATGENAISTQYCFTVQNTPPVFNETIGAKAVESGTLFSLNVNCTDPVDNDTITYYDNTSLFEINSTNGTIVDTPVSAEIGDSVINITCSDGEVNTSQLFTYSITAVPSPPSGSPSPPVAGPAAPSPAPAPAPAPSPAPEAPSAEEGEFSSPAEAQQNIGGSIGGVTTIYGDVNESIILINQTIEEKRKRSIEEVAIILENKGTKRMRLFPTISQEFADPYFIVTRKTLGYSDSFFSKIANLAYSEKPVFGRLLSAEIVNPEQIILEPGQRLEKKLQIREGLATDKELKIQFTTEGQVVFEKELPSQKKIFSGSAIDSYPQENALDIYVFIAPPIPTEKLQEYYHTHTSETLTGAAVLNSAFKNVLRDDEYLLEVSIIKNGEELPKDSSLFKEIKNSLFGKKTYFSDLYGPYKLKQEQIFIFAQQLKYNPKEYTGDYFIRTTIYKGSTIIVKNEFEATLG